VTAHITALFTGSSTAPTPRAILDHVRVFLASDGLDALPAFLAPSRVQRIAFVPTAANGLDDRDAFVAVFRKRLQSMGLEVIDCDVDTLTMAAAEAVLDVSDALFVGGGDAFHLLARIRWGRFDRAILAAVARGLPYVGVSAGAIVAGPSLAPIMLTSPFAPAVGLSLEGLGLVDRVVLPHHDRPGRAAPHAEAMRRFGGAMHLVPLADDEALVVEDGAMSILRGRDAQR
jgi:dipeptidase E